MSKMTLKGAPAYVLALSVVVTLLGGLVWSVKFLIQAIQELWSLFS